MTLRIFVLSDPEDAACAQQIQRGCEDSGYQVWTQSSLLQAVGTLSPANQDYMVIGSAAIILIWSQAIARAAEVERLLLFAQRLQKNIIALALDATPLPMALVTMQAIAIQRPCDRCMDQIAPLLPPAGNQDALQALVERASHEYIRERKAAIEQAATMLQHNEHREATLALLKHLAQHDTITSVRDKAQEILNAYTQPATQPPTNPPQDMDSNAIFGVRCKNGHVSYFDKRYVCKATYEVPRGLNQRTGNNLDELVLSCTTCGATIVAYVDCEGYK